MCEHVLYVVDADPVARQCVQRLLRSTGAEVRAFASAIEFLQAYDGQGPGCVFLDLCLPGGTSGLDLLTRLDHTSAPLSVVCMSGHGDVRATVAAMKHGAFDFLVKPIEEQALLSVVAAALRHSTARWSAQQQRAALRDRFNTLTPREREVCQLVAAGYLNKQAAYELGTAEKTIKVHRARVMSKLQVGSVAELVRLVDHLAAIPPPAFTAPRAIAGAAQAAAF